MLVLHRRLTPDQLHRAIQAAFAWTDTHLHHFHDAKEDIWYSIPERASGGFGLDPWGEAQPDERRVTLDFAFDGPGSSLMYEYDFGDSWEHSVRFEGYVDGAQASAIVDSQATRRRPVNAPPRAAMCLDGANSRPPEDCGGIFEYQRLRELLRSGKVPREDQEAVEWLESSINSPVDFEQINREMARIKVKKAYLK